MPVETPYAVAAAAAFAALLFILLWPVFSSYVLAGPFDNVPGPKAASWWKGNFDQLFDRQGWQFQDELIEKYSSVVTVHSVFGRKMLYVYDATTLYDIVIKNSYTFEPLLWFLSFVGLVFGPGLPATHGNQHRRQRKLLNPVFSGAFIRSLTPTFYAVAHKMRSAMLDEINGKPKELDILKWAHRTALEAFGRGGLGYSLDPIDAPPSDAYGVALKLVSPAVFSLGFLRMLSPLLSLLPSTTRHFLARFVPHTGVRKVATLSSIMDDKTKEIFFAKEAAIRDGSNIEGDGSDIMSVLMRTNMEANPEDQLPKEELIAQMSTLAFAGTDTTTSAIAQVVDLLSKHTDVQEKLRSELVTALDGGDLGYDALMALPAMKAAVLPLSKPIQGVDGTVIDKIVIPKGTTLILGVRGCNLNRDIWGPDAREWKPERWLSPLPETVKSAKVPGVYSHMMTFLGGGRACVGFKFSQLEMKVVLSVLLSSFRFTRSRDIYWNIATFNYPTASRDSTVPEMPVHVEAL
ncbi:hypothetical protein EUX98_g6458 [Antrodiella citrinella]|uniref:Cytochrome P450 n=1 Tax=Antrodiella citrinella TaxID=2447956 RepID=A0A4S4MR28_9APHY|nr:hypothetical protein EUX98_g6458 [Antrodiella citrinella]